MLEQGYEVRALDERTWGIRDPGDVLMYLVCGTERAVLVDSGYGAGDLAALVAQLTALPVTVINTHGHPDHVLGNGQFTEALVAAADAPVLDAFARPEVVDTMRAHFSARWGVPPAQLAAWPGAPAAVWPLHDGQRIALGGRTLEVIATPGHTPGSVCLLDHATRWLFTGDTLLAGTLWLHLRESLPLAVYYQTLQRLAALRPAFDGLLPGHAALEQLPLATAILDVLLDGLPRLLSGALTGVPESTPAGDGLRCDFAGCAVLYRPERLTAPAD